MKIAHLEFGRHAYGGAEQLKYLLEGLTDDHHAHLLVAAAGGDLARWAAESDRPHEALAFSGEHDLRAVFRLGRFLREQGVDLVHVHSRRGADWIGPLAAMRAGVPAIISRRIDNPPRFWLRWLMRNRYRRVVCISQAIQGVLESAGVSRDNLLTITSAVEARRYGHPPPDDARRQLLGRDHRGPLIGVIAQLIDRKGHRFLLRALPGLREAYPDLAVVFLGRGALRETLEAEVDAAGLAGCVHFAGFREDLAGLLPALDLVVHPALMEGLGVSLLEAAAAGVPVVGFAAGGVMEAVADEHSGLLVESGDAIALGAAIGRLLGDPELRKRMGDNARRRVEAEFSIEVMVNRYAALYDVLAGEIE
ncbi:MAG: glycosyltransferase [Pseudomonadota bacterium]